MGSRLISALLVAAFLFAGTVKAQQATSADSTSVSTSQQDPQAVTILNQALNAAGGLQTINAISDYTATGSITYYPGQQVEGTVKIIGLNGTEFRIDSALPMGTRSWVVHDGVVSAKSENGTVYSQISKSNVPSSDAYPFETPLFPASLLFPVEPLGTIVSGDGFGTTYKGLAQADGRSVYNIQMRRILSPPPPNTFASPLQQRSLLIDSSNFQIVQIGETLPKNVIHEVHYSDYRAVNGVLTPFSISEVINGQTIWMIKLNQITFNNNLQESAFALQ